MAWISVHEQLKDHRKVRELSKKLECSKHEAAGIVVFLWIWGINNADRDGGLGNASAEDIADGIMYHSQDPKMLLNGLKESGWIDEEGGEYILHDWAFWQKQWYDALDKREVNARRMREARAKEKEATVVCNAQCYERCCEQYRRCSTARASLTVINTVI